MKRFYAKYWDDPSHAPPIDDPDRGRRVAVVHKAMARAGATDLLDVGCGRGDFASEANDLGLHVVGMELDASAVDAGRERFPGLSLVVHSIDDAPWPWPAGSFDGVSAIEVVEHLVDPARLFAEARRVLRPAGMLFVTTPFHGRVKNLLLGMSLSRFERHFANLESGHIRFYTDRHLKEVLGAAGFSVMDVVHYGRRWPVWRGVLLVARRNG